jgi:hypothetical protein
LNVVASKVQVREGEGVGVRGGGDIQSGSAFFFGAAFAEDLRLPMLREWFGVARTRSE